jgi:hypothetical protein
VLHLLAPFVRAFCRCFRVRITSVVLLKWTQLGRLMRLLLMTDAQPTPARSFMARDHKSSLGLTDGGKLVANLSVSDLR